MIEFQYVDHEIFLLFQQKNKTKQTKTNDKIRKVKWIII
jgi:hypothetical protein